MKDRSTPKSISMPLTDWEAIENYCKANRISKSKLLSDLWKKFALEQYKQSLKEKP